MSLEGILLSRVDLEEPLGHLKVSARTFTAPGQKIVLKQQYI